MITIKRWLSTIMRKVGSFYSSVTNNYMKNAVCTRNIYPLASQLSNVEGSRHSL